MAMASNLIAMASILMAMASNLIAVATNLYSYIVLLRGSSSWVCSIVNI